MNSINEVLIYAYMYVRVYIYYIQFIGLSYYMLLNGYAYSTHIAFDFTSRWMRSRTDETASRGFIRIDSTFPWASFHPLLPYSIISWARNCSDSLSFVFLWVVEGIWEMIGSFYPLQFLGHDSSRKGDCITWFTQIN